MNEFKLWLEFEYYEDGSWDRKNQAANVNVELPDGRRYGINVWTYRFLETVIVKDKETGENLNGLYQTPPDLFVEELTEDCMKKSIDDLLRKGNLEDGLNPSIIAED